MEIVETLTWFIPLGLSLQVLGEHPELTDHMEPLRRTLRAA